MYWGKSSGCHRKVSGKGVKFRIRGNKMNVPEDLSGILNDWPYDPEDNVRFLSTGSGRDIMQIRQPLGVEQYLLDGRPDGLKPEGEDTLLSVYIRKKAEAENSGGSLTLGEEDFRKLKEEGILYYYRYLALFQVGQYDRVARDTGHNLKIAELLEQYCESDYLKEILQYRPYIRRMNAVARAMVLLAEDKNSRARDELKKGLEDIKAFPNVKTAIFDFEKIRSLQHLSQLLSQVEASGTDNGEPKGFKLRLSEELEKAVENEDYERAAGLRDRLHRLGSF